MRKNILTRIWRFEAVPVHSISQSSIWDSSGWQFRIEKKPLKNYSQEWKLKNEKKNLVECGFVNGQFLDAYCGIILW